VDRIVDLGVVDLGDDVEGGHAGTVAQAGEAVLVPLD
jgi:hypothetical protein